MCIRDRTWREYDATALVASVPFHSPIRVDQGSADQFLEKQLHPERFADACRESGQALDLRMHGGYDHGYYFISTFIEEHLRFHAERLGA